MAKLTSGVPHPEGRPYNNQVVIPSGVDEKGKPVVEVVDEKGKPVVEVIAETDSPLMAKLVADAENDAHGNGATARPNPEAKR